MEQLEPPTTTNRPAKRSPIHIWLAVALVAYGPQFLIEVAVLFGILLAWQTVWDQHLEPPVQIALGLALTAVGMGAGEAGFRLYQRVWRVAGPRDALPAALAALEAILIITIVNGLVPPDWRPFHALLPLIASPMAVIAVTAFRLLPRIASATPLAENRFLIVVGDSSQYGTVKALIQNPRALWSPVAIVTSNPAEVRRTVMGIPVVGEASDLAHWIQVTRADGVAFVQHDDNPDDFRELLGVALAQERPVFIVPQTEEWFRSDGQSPLRQLSADDLVGRRPHETDLRLSEEAISGKTVLVTGAAGSVGSELSRILATLNPKRLVLLDNNESGLFEIVEELRDSVTIELSEALVSVTDMDRLLSIFAEERPDIVFHAAAYKHVPMLEGHPEQAVTINVIGTANTVRCAEAAGTRHFVLISTDKAASRYSVMGCTKRLCELIVLGHKGNMRGWAVRFGNVVGSRGSVVPTFERQIRRRGPVTITHPDATRYLMTTREAAALVITTVAMATHGHLYMLDMGEPVRILDLANALIRARGLRPGKDIEVVFTGLRPGERLTEDLLAPDEGWRPSAHPAILEVVTPVSRDAGDLDWTIERLRELAKEQRSDELVRVLKLAVTAPAAAHGDEPTLTVPRRKEAEAEGGH